MGAGVSIGRKVGVGSAVAFGLDIAAFGVGAGVSAAGSSVGAGDAFCTGAAANTAVGAGDGVVSGACSFPFPQAESGRAISPASSAHTIFLLIWGRPYVYSGDEGLSFAKRFHPAVVKYRPR
jgi:hypothetical protein